MTNLDDLRLYEKAMLLILKDDEGTVGIMMHHYALGGALLAELLLGGCVETSGDGGLVAVVDRSSLNDPLLDECLERIASSEEQHNVQHWVTHFATTKKLTQRVAEGLCERGVLRADEGKVLLIFSRKIYPELDPEPERQLVARLEEAIFTDTEDIAPDTAVLVGLGHKARLLNGTFEPGRLKGRHERIEAIARGDLVSEGAGKAVKSAETVLLVCCVF